MLGAGGTVQQMAVTQHSPESKTRELVSYQISSRSVGESLVIGSLARQTDVTLYVLFPATLLRSFTTQPYRRFPWNVSRS